MGRKLKASIAFGEGAPNPNDNIMIIFASHQGSFPDGNFLSLGADSAMSPNAAAAASHGNVLVMPLAGVISKLHWNLGSNATGTASSATVYKNGVATALVVTLNTGVTTGSDLTHQVDVAVGDLIAVKFASDTDATNFVMSSVFNPS